MIDEGSTIREKYGLDYIRYCVKIDWSIDSTKDWKYNPDWDKMITHTGDEYCEAEYVNEDLQWDITERKSIFGLSMKADPKQVEI